MPPKKKSAQGAGTPQGTNTNKSNVIVSKIIDIVNLSEEEIKQSAVKKLTDEDKQTNNSPLLMIKKYSRLILKQFTTPLIEWLNSPKVQLIRIFSKLRLTI